ncbi:cytochrome P450 714A2-like [Apium graveolens]|uniref:cytochrome P450 714A2-like n=1 Tax=Apium graveolens TaxID=4045 RepID=UPI003D79334A
MSREASKDIKFGDIHVQKGVHVWAVVTSLRTDPEIWGEDSYKFNPGRFANGVTGACWSVDMSWTKLSVGSSQDLDFTDSVRLFTFSFSEICSDLGGKRESNPEPGTTRDKP